MSRDGDDDVDHFLIHIGCVGVQRYACLLQLDMKNSMSLLCEANARIYAMMKMNRI